jgi:transcriptional regulatory protein LevR
MEVYFKNFWKLPKNFGACLGFVRTVGKYLELEIYRAELGFLTLLLEANIF